MLLIDTMSHSEKLLDEALGQTNDKLATNSAVTLLVLLSGIGESIQQLRCYR